LDKSLSAPFFERSSFAASAVNPPVDITLPIINAALAMHAGHIEFLLKAKNEPATQKHVCAPLGRRLARYLRSSLN